MFLLHGFIAVNRDEIISREVTVSQVMHDYGDVCQWGAEANDSPIHARNLFGEGCVFTVDLPRYPVRAVEVVQA